MYETKYVLVIFGLGTIIMGGVLYGAVIALSSPSTVTIGEGYINVETGITGVGNDKNVTSEGIYTAFVGYVGSGDFTLRKQSGTHLGDTSIGRFTLGNGATAYMATTNSTCLIMGLKSGEYIIVGNQDTQTIANSFAQNVHQLTS